MNFELPYHICQECQKDCGDMYALHKHVRTHKLSLVEYYQKHYPRYDKWTGDIIRFKNKEFYFTADFNDRLSLKEWIAHNSKDTIKEYVIDFLKKRQERKKVVYTPSQVEMRTLPIVGMKYINDNIGDYYKFCADLGFKNRFSKYSFPTDTLHKNFKIIVDSREQRPLEFKVRTEVSALKFGDYCLKNEDKRNDCYIERKSVNDLFGTLSGGFERFCREIERAVEANAYLIVLVEGSISDTYTFPLARALRGKINLSPEYIFHNVRELTQKYHNIQFLFVNGRNEASRVVETIFASGEDYKATDLQYMYDCKLL